MVSITETWESILSASSPEGFRDGTPSVEYLQDGQEFKIVIETEWWAPIAPFFDLFIGEWFVATFLNVGGSIIEVWGEGLHTIVIWARANASVASTATRYGPLLVIPVIPITTAIAVAIITVGLAVAISLITLFIKISGGTADIIGLMVMMMVMVMMMGLIGKQLLPSEEETGG